MSYYEAHITFEPIFGVQLEVARSVCSQFGFRVADLLMKKRPEDTPERSQFDTFCTGRGKDVDKLRADCLACVDALTEFGVDVWRHKIEHVIEDQRYNRVVA